MPRSISLAACKAPRQCWSPVFGGGTSDFSVIRFERQDGRVRARPLGNAGIGIAGDTFDYRIIDHVVSPLLGKYSNYRSFGKVLTLPNGYYSNFARWNQLALMKTTGELRQLRELARYVEKPEMLERFIEIIENDHGFALYKAVSSVKAMLSTEPQGEFCFCAGNVDIETSITRGQFEDWIAPDVRRIERTVDDALADAKVDESQIVHVFLTGGSSFIPAIQRLFVERFGEARIDAGDRFESIASGLALIGLGEDVTQWTVPRAR